MKICKSAFLLIIASVACFAETDKKDQLLLEKIEFFYLDSNPITAQQIIKDSLDLKCIDNFFYFFVALAKEHPKEVIKWLADAQVKFEQHPALIEALHLGGLEGEAVQLALKAHWHAQKIMPLGNKVQPFLNVPVGFPGSIPCMCSHFYVSGDARDGKKIIDILELTQQQVKNPEELKELKEQVKAVLQVLVFKHDRIYRLCLQEAKTRKGDVQVALNRILQELHEWHKKPFSKQEGIFKAVIVATDDLNFEKEWENLPAMDGPFCKAISSIPYPRNNTAVKIFILFTGCELDKDLNAHVTYDMEIFDPQGSKIGESHNAPAIQRKLPSRFFFQKADHSAGLVFDASDEKDEDPYSPGTYIIKATLKDHIGKKDLKLSTTLELLPEHPTKED